MNIYKKQMKQLGLNIKQYAELLNIPEEIVRKSINGNGEVVDSMEINNFLRKNLFSKHQEVENNKEEKKVEAFNIKLERGQKKSYDAKKQWLLERYPNSKEVNWYINEYNKKEYFKKNDVQNRADLMRRYTFTCNEGRLKKQKEAGITTIARLTNKKYDELGTESAYPLICQLYDCLELGNIKERTGKARNYYYTGNAKKGKRGFQEITLSDEEKEMKKWYDEFDFKEFCKKYNISSFEMGVDLDISNTTVKQIKKGAYRPSMKMIHNLKKYVDSFENKQEIEIKENEQAKVIDTSNIGIMQPIQNHEEILRNLLKNRLTEEKRTLIRIFGGNI